MGLGGGDLLGQEMSLSFQPFPPLEPLVREEVVGVGVWGGWLSETFNGWVGAGGGIGPTLASLPLLLHATPWMLIIYNDKDSVRGDDQYC